MDTNANPRFIPDIDAVYQRLQVTPDFLKARWKEEIAIDSTSVDQLRQASRPFGSLPLIVLTQSEAAGPDPSTSGFVKSHEKVAALSTIGEDRIVADSSHNIPFDQPYAVIIAINDVLNRMLPDSPYQSKQKDAPPDLLNPFHTRSPWRLVVTASAPVKDYNDSDAPGALSLCLQRSASEPCVFDLTTPAAAKSPDDSPGWEPHYLLDAEVVYPKGPKAAPLLMLVTASFYSGDGDQLITTQLLRYDASHDEFQRVFSQQRGHNNNQEIRFITGGPLRGDVISAKPMQHRPYGFEIVVNALSSAGTYREILRFRSATLYGDGNHLAVIDSEMPTIQRRLGMWKPGQPLPAPATLDGKPCDKPVLKHSELWCD